MSMDIKIVDNFLPKTYLEHLQSHVLGYRFPWYYHTSTTSIDGDTNHMFCHIALKDDGEKGGFYPVLEPMIEQMQQIEPIREVRRIKLNLYPNQGETVHHVEHVDQEGFTADQVVVGVFSINGCNGGTVIDGRSIEAHENRLVLFDNVRHHGFTQTDTPVRACINFNFIR